jgi:hypothetical protein
MRVLSIDALNLPRFSFSQFKRDISFQKHLRNQYKRSFRRKKFAHNVVGFHIWRTSFANLFGELLLQVLISVMI